MKHIATPAFWERYNALPSHARQLADKNFELLKNNSDHPSLHLKKVGKYRSVRIGNKYRALAVDVENGLLWFWIGTHEEYNQLIK